MEVVPKQIIRHPFKVGQRLADRYVVQKILGSGSMGWVLKVADEELEGTSIALKVLYPHLSKDSVSVARFRGEVLLARQLSHPSIIHVHDLSEGTAAGLFLAMEYIEGSSLAEILAERHGKGLPFDEALYVLTKVAEGLLYAHQQGIVHRDLKPGNILVGSDASVKIGDFGLAKSFQQELGLTRTGEALGSPLYMAPEQFEAKAIDQRADIYAFGILAFELLTGRPPFDDDGFFELARQHLEAPLPTITTIDGNTTAWLVEIINRCCAKAPADRPNSIDEFLPLLRQQLPLKTTLRLAKGKRLRRQRTRKAQIRRLIAAAVVVGVGLFTAQYTLFPEFRIEVASSLLRMEYELKLELTPLKALLGIRGSLLRPESAFALVREDQSLNLKSLLEGSTRLRTIHPDYRVLALIKDSNGSTLLHRAVELNSQELVDAFYDSGASYTSRDGNGETPATLAVKLRHLKALRSLVEQPRFSADTTDMQGNSPLHLAVKNRDLMAIQILQRAHANPDSRTNDGFSATHLAIAIGDEAIISELLTSGKPNLTVQDSKGRTPLVALLAIDIPEDRRHSILKLLLTNIKITADLNALDHEGRSALIHAVLKGDEQSVALLIAAGADSARRDTFGKQAQDYARESGRTELLAVLHSGTSGDAA